MEQNILSNDLLRDEIDRLAKKEFIYLDIIIIFLTTYQKIVHTSLPVSFISHSPRHNFASDEGHHVQK